MIVYEADPEYSCLVEMDEEPPGPLNEEAVETGLIVAALVNANPVEEIHVMRKIVIDGSNTTGFQRTCVVALGGQLRAGSIAVGVQQISLEEDAARKTGEDASSVSYRLDRLGIPLIEVSTAPDMTTPQMVEDVALAIGNILKATRRVKRGIGSIRQDLNVSTRDGALVEIKGVQELELIARVVDYEVERQAVLLGIREELLKRGVTAQGLQVEAVDCTGIFRESKSRVIERALKKGGVVKAVRLRKFTGLLGRELCPNVRLGTEFSAYAVFWGRVGGIFHTDELPGYGITEREISATRELTLAEPDDAVVLVADLEPNATDAIDAVLERAKEALKGVPEETRTAQADATTRYMRPRPGAARMYPETDVPSFPVTAEFLAKVKRDLPPPREAVVRELMSTHRLSQKLAEQVADSEHLPLFSRLSKSGAIPAGFLASTLIEGLTSLRRDGIPVNMLDDSTIEQVFEAVEQGRVAKESALDILAWLSGNPSADLTKALQELKLEMLSLGALERIVQKHVSLNKDLIQLDTERAFNVIMGRVMGEVRGRADSQRVSELIKKKIRKQDD